MTLGRGLKIAFAELAVAHAAEVRNAAVPLDVSK